MKYRILIFLAATVHVGLLHAQVPALINYQGRVAVNGGDFDGAGQFKFALVGANGSPTFWSNDGTSVNGSQPTSAVTLTVDEGLYSVLLGDTTLGNMIAVPVGAFANPNVRLRVWFNDGTNGFQLLTPDQRLAPSAYLADDSVTSAAIADGAVTTARLAPGAVTGATIAQGTIGGANVAPGSLDHSRLTVPSAPAPGQVLSFNGSSLAWTPPAGGIWSLNGSSAYYNGGSVGLGTTTPKHQLSIRSFAGGPTWTTNGWIGAIDLDNASAIAWGANSGGHRFGMGHTNGSFVMWRTAADPGTTASGAFYDFAIADNGNVGIGITAPATKLHVLGHEPGWVEAAVQNTGGRAIMALNSTISGANRIWSIENGLFGTAGLFGVYDRTAGQARMIIDTAGNVGLGTNAPAARLQVSSSGNLGAPQAQLTQNISGEYARLRFSATGSPSTWDIASGTAGGVMTFYAASTNRNVMVLNPNGTVSVGVLNITGGADLAEPFQMGEEEIEKGSVVVIDEKRPGRLKRSIRAYDKRVAGIVSGANGVNPGIALQQEGVLEGGQNVSLSGRVYVKADTANGPIQPGDLLTSSARPGHAMRVKDHKRAQGAVIGKAMTALDEESGMVLVLVTLQ